MSASVIYAPIAIATLCRYEHFKECLESLMHCTSAGLTDVYVGVDYPAKEEHVEGWEKITRWLEEIKGTHNFKSLNVIRRTSNMGLGEGGNMDTLITDILKEHDRIIISEDDNIFAPAFLDYINKGLEKFKDDPSVLAINGYRHMYNVEFDGNTFYRQNVDFSAWGYGMWRDKRQQLMMAKEKAYWRKKFLNPVNLRRVYLNGLNRLFEFTLFTRNVNRFGDCAFSVYMAINKMDVVMPAVSMVRNMGWDGTGEHCNSDGPGWDLNHSGQRLSEEKDFVFIGNGKEYYKQNRKTYVKESYGRITLSQFIKKFIKGITKRIGL